MEYSRVSSLTSLGLILSLEDFDTQVEEFYKDEWIARCDRKVETTNNDCHSGKM